MRGFEISVTRDDLQNWVSVKLYPTRKHMARAARRFNGNGQHDGVCGVTQLRFNSETREQWLFIRLAETDLTLDVISHEVHHVANSLYAAGNDPCVGDEPLSEHATHFNEDAAYLYSLVLMQVVGGLARRGFQIEWTA